MELQNYMRYPISTIHIFQTQYTPCIPHALHCFTISQCMLNQGGIKRNRLKTLIQNLTKLG